MSARRFEPLRPNPKQAQFIAAMADPSTNVKIAVGGAGAGKSQTIVQGAREAAITIPGNEVLVARKFLKDVLKTTYREFLRTTPREWIVDIRKQDHEIILRSTDHRYPSRITFGGFDEPSRWGSSQFGQAFFDESHEFDYEDFVVIRQRLRHPALQDVTYESPFIHWDPKRKEWDMMRFLALVTNPVKNPDHWLRRLYKTSTVDKKRYAVFVIRIPTYDNKDHLPGDYLQTLEDQPEEERRRMLNAEDTPGIIGDACTPHYIDKPIEDGGHVITGPLPDHAMGVVRGWDFGYRHTSISWGEVINKAAIYLWAESFTERMTLEEVITGVLFPGEAAFNDDCEWKDWVDHQAANQHTDKTNETCRSIMRKHGLSARSNYSKPRDRAQLLDDLFRTRRMFVHESCRWHREAFGGYWHRDKFGEPEKDGVFDHVGDSAGYLAINELGARGVKLDRPLDVTPGQRAIDPEAPFRLKAARGGVTGFRLPAMGGAA